MSNRRKVFLDTSFFIRLTNQHDEHHSNARAYFQRFSKEDAELLTSTIVVAEYGIGAPIQTLPFRSLKLLPFNFDHAEVAAQFAKAAYGARRKGAVNVSGRVVIPNDTKLFAQAAVEQATLFIGRDDNCQSVCNFLKQEGLAQLDYLDLRTPPSEHFGELFDEV
jgi:predicted nucleic acid-binding protein